MNKIALWIESSRPKTLFVSISTILIGTSIAAAEGTLNAITFFCSLFGCLFLQIGTNFANDAFDVKKGSDTRIRKGPIRPIHRGLVSMREMQYAAFFAFFMSFLASIYLIYHGGIYIGLLFFLAVLLGIGYTAGSFSLSNLGLGDLFVFLVFGPIGCFVTYFLQTHKLNETAAIAGIAPGLLSIAILVVNNLRDAEEDRLTNKRTLAVKFGEKFSKLQFALCIIFACCIPLYLNEHRFSMLAALGFIPGYFLIRQIYKETDPRKLNPLLGKTAQLLLFYTLFFSFGWLL